MKNLILILSLFFSVNAFSQTTLTIDNIDFHEEIVGISMIGDKIILRNVFYICYNGTEYDFQDSLYNALFIFMKNNPNLIFEISNHTDAQGNSKYNLKLSKRIAKNLKNYFVKKGISKRRIKAIGMGETEILNECKNGIKCTDEKHRKNRRIEIKIIDIKES